MTIFGVPLNVSAASSKAEAIEMLGRRTTRLPSGRGIAPFTVALIDVVMETDTAGLELWQYIRDTMKEKITQIYISLWISVAVIRSSIIIQSVFEAHRMQ